VMKKINIDSLWIAENAKLFIKVNSIKRSTRKLIKFSLLLAARVNCS